MTGHPKPSKGIESMRLADERIHGRKQLAGDDDMGANGLFHHGKNSHSYFTSV